MKLACILLPKKCSDNSVAFSNTCFFENSLIKPTIWSASGYSDFVDLTISPVGISEVEIIDIERFGLSFSIFLGFAPVSKSKTRYASDSPLATLLEQSAFSGSKIFKWDTTDPPFWLSPVWSNATTFLFSKNAAVDIIWLTVTTPVPPIPSINIFPIFALDFFGSGILLALILVSGNDLLSPLSEGITLINEGQFPSTHE